MRQLLKYRATRVDFLRTSSTGVNVNLKLPIPNDIASGQCPFQPKLTTNSESSGVNQGVITNTTSSIFEGKIKPFANIPKPAGKPIFGSFLDFFRGGGGENLPFETRKRHAELGPLYREVVNSANVLFVGSPSGMQDIYKHETNSPAVFNGAAFSYFNQIHNKKRGLFFMNGDEWRKLRSLMNNLVLRKKDLSELYDKSQETLTTELEKWGKIAEANGGYLPKTGKKIHEAGIPGFAAILMGKSFENYRSSVEADAAVFHEVTTLVWKYNMKMQIIPPKWAHKLHLPLWKKFENAMFSSIGIGPKWVDQVVQDIGSTGHDGLIQMMLKDYKMEHKDVARIIGDVVTAAETEFTMISWLIYVLGRHPEAQDKVFAELNKVCGVGKKLDHRDLDKTEFLRSCLKEVMRLYPVPVFTTRFLQKDAIVGGYHIPAGTLAALNLYSAQRDPKFFPDPDQFLPERWFRSTKRTSPNNGNDLWDSEIEVGMNAKYAGVHHGANAYMTFGWGTRRGCVFRKVSLVRMHLFLGRLIQEFKFTCDDVKPKMVSVMIPDRDLNLKLKKRN